VDRFVGDLVSDLAALFSADSVAHPTIGLVEQATSAFEEGTKPIRRMLQDAEARATQAHDSRATRLAELATSITGLRAGVKALADDALQEFEKERFDTAARATEEQARARTLERRARSLKLKHADLEAARKHQKVEKESVGRLLKQIDESRRDWGDSCSDPASATVQKLQKEIEILRNDLTNETTDEFEHALDECITVMNDAREALQDEMCQIDVIERWAVARLRSPMRRGSIPTADPQPRQSALLAAKDRIEASRKRRELSMRQVNDSMRGLNENQAQ
jgi:hypothetical protein